MCTGINSAMHTYIHTYIHTVQYTHIHTPHTHTHSIPFSRFCGYKISGAQVGEAFITHCVDTRAVRALRMVVL